MGLRKKILIASSIFITCIVIFGAFCTVLSYKLISNSSDTQTHEVQIAHHVHDLSLFNHKRIRLIEELAAGYGENEESFKTLEFATKKSEQYLDYLKTKSAFSKSVYFAKLENQHNYLKAFSNELKNRLDQHQKISKAKMNEFDEVVEPYINELDEAFDEVLAIAQSSANSAKEDYTSLLGKLWLAMLGILSLSFLSSYFYSKHLSVKITEAVAEIEKISSVIANESYGGRTVQHVTADSRSHDDEIHHLARATNLLKIGLQRSTELKEALENERTKSAFSSKLASLGEMAGGIAHEVNTPLAIINMRASQLKEFLQENELDREMMIDMAGDIESTCMRIAKIIKSLKSFSRDGSQDPFATQSLKHIISESVGFCTQKFKENSVELTIPAIADNLVLECRETEIVQVLLNLLNNSFDAIEKLPEKWVKIAHTDFGDSVEIRVTDSGKGIPESVLKKLFQPFFTTKEVGKGTGLGLGISKRIIENHGGILIVNSDSPNTEFIIWLSKKRPEQSIDSSRKVA